MIENDKPIPAEPATPEERALILDELSQYFSPDKILSLDGEKRRGLRKCNQVTGDPASDLGGADHQDG